MNFYVITLFPKSMDSYLKESILKRAIEDKKIKVIFLNPRDFISKGKKDKLTRSETRIDKKPYGGGPGMVIQAEPVIKAIRANALGGSEVSGRDVCDLVYDLDDRTGTDRSKVGKFFGGVRYDIRCPICDGEVDFPPQEFDKETCRIHGRVKSETWDDRIKVTRKFVEALHAEE
jgi:hypothetical protein